MQITTQNQYNTSYKGGLKSLNALNPISYYTNSYFKHSAKMSNKNFMPISDSLIGKIKKIKLGRISAWDINPKNSKDYLFCLHGMSQNVSNYQAVYETALKNKKAVFAVEYRSYGENKPAILSEDRLRNDVEKAYKFLTEEKNIRSENIIVVGHSMGGALATNFASKHKDIKALILLSPIRNMTSIGKKFLLNKTLGIGVPPKINKLPDKIKPLKWLFSLRFNSQKKIKKVNTPTYILQSENDSVTLLNGAKKLVKTAQEKEILKDFTIFPTGGHKVDSKKVEALNKILGEI